MDRLSELIEIAVPLGVSRKNVMIRSRESNESLSGKRVGLLWNRKPNGDVLLRRLGKRLKERYPDIEVVWLGEKNDSARGAPTESLEEARRECDAAIVAVGD